MNDLTGTIVKKLTIGEMIRLMHGVWGLHGMLPFTYPLTHYRTRDIKRFGIPRLRFTDGPKGINLNRSTCFPVAMARGATFDPILEERVSTAMGIEARHQGANTVGSTCINIVRHPGWGRSQETFGADTYHMSVMGAAHVRGLAKNVMPVVKHFACNSIENTRFKVNITIDERTLREIYLPHFKAAIDAGAAAIMSAYNKLNGIYCGENRHLLTEILRDEWKFDGFVMSDFFLGCHSTVPSVKAGLDIEMPMGWFYRAWRIRRALNKGLITRDDIEASATRIIETMRQFGILKSFTAEPRKYVACKAHTDLALEVARKSIVLLKNENGMLPLDAKSINTIAVIGKHAKKPVMGDIASSAVKPPWKISLLTAIQEKMGSSCKIIHASSLRKAKKAALKADVTIILISLTWRDEGENIPIGCGDRIRLELSPRAVRLIRETARINPCCIVVLQGGSAICMDEWIDEIPAILMAWYPGMQGGNAIADVLLGNYNPAGRLPLTIPKSTEQLPLFDTNSLEITYDYWHDYRYFDHHGLEPRYYFGYGLSYTRFKYHDIAINPSKVLNDNTIHIKVIIQNAGDRDGDEVVQLYVDYRNSKIKPRARRELKGFKRIHVERGKQATVEFTLRTNDLAWYDVEKRKWEVEKMKYGAWVGSSLADLPLYAEFIVE